MLQQPQEWQYASGNGISLHIRRQVCVKASLPESSKRLHTYCCTHMVLMGSTYLAIGLIAAAGNIDTEKL